MVGLIDPSGAAPSTGAQPGRAPDGGPTLEGMGGWPSVLARLVAGQSLSVMEAEVVIGQVLEGAATPAQVAAFVTALRVKGESVEEMTGFVRSMLEHAEPFPLDPELSDQLVDVVGTGGDRLASINVSTLAALVAAGAGAPVCKHGNRAASSSVGTADVLESLGVAVDLGPAGVARCIAEAGMGFCFAPRFHPAMRYAGPVRRELGIPTVFNFLGPLANPARTRRQLVGVSDPSMALTMAGVLGANGSRRAIVAYADDGLDELSVTTPSTALEVTGAGDGEDFEVRTWRLDPTDLGFSPASMEDLRGGNAEFNAAAIRRVLEGERSARRDIGLLNAAAALLVAGRADDVADGVAQAADAVDSGRALAVLETLVRVSSQAAAAEGA